jgi:hypothetical protein
MGRMRTAGRLAIVSAVAAASMGLAARQTPPPTFTVVAGSEPDADPGDGVCADNRGECSLRAAIEEANSLGRATILLPAFLQEGTPPAITSRVQIRPEGRSAGLDGVGLIVGPSGVLDLTGTYPEAEGGGASLTVHGRATIHEATLDELEVSATRKAALVRASVTFDPDYPTKPTSVANAGTQLIWYSQVWVSPITSAPDALTAVTASLIAAPCTGTLTSGGYNAGRTRACVLRAATDLDETDVYLGVGRSEGSRGYDLSEDSPLWDHIPEGVAGCGLSATVAPDPKIEAFDGRYDTDAIAACEVGPYQGGPGA